MTSVKILREEVKEYIEQADERVVKMVHAMLETDIESDWWERMPDTIKTDVKAAMKEADEGKLIPHEEIRKKYSKWLTK
jgi:predicted transcriptional regulator